MTQKKDEAGPNELHALLAKEMAKLSLTEREQVYHDVHGVADVIDETPEMLSRSLEKLEDEICKIPNKATYELAMLQNEEYVSNRDFRLRFLRADRFNIKQAAHRMVRHFEVKLEFFGKEMLARDIRLKDLNADDIKVMESGFAQLCPLRDRAGRAIPIIIPGICCGSVESKVGRQWMQT